MGRQHVPSDGWRLDFFKFKGAKRKIREKEIKGLLRGAFIRRALSRSLSLRSHISAGPSCSLSLFLFFSCSLSLSSPLWAAIAAFHQGFSVYLPQGLRPFVLPSALDPVSDSSLTFSLFTPTSHHATSLALSPAPPPPHLLPSLLLTCFLHLHFHRAGGRMVAGSKDCREAARMRGNLRPGGLVRPVKPFNSAFWT